MRFGLAWMAGIVALAAQACNQAPPPPPPSQGCAARGGSPSGGGYSLQQSGGDGLWRDVKEILVAKCMGCHTADGYDQYEKAKTSIDALIRVVDLAPDEPLFMPQRGEKLALADRSKLILWKAVGMPQTGFGGLAGFGSSGTPPGGADESTLDQYEREQREREQREREQREREEREREPEQRPDAGGSLPAQPRC